MNWRIKVSYFPYERLCVKRIADFVQILLFVYLWQFIPLRGDGELNGEKLDARMLH